jgi:hypothetical protein
MLVVCLCSMRPYLITVSLYASPELLSGGDLVIDQISPRQELQTHIQTDSNDIRPHTAQTHNECTSTESNLATAQSAAHESPDGGHTYGPKHVGAASLKMFLTCF